MKKFLKIAAFLVVFTLLVPALYAFGGRFVENNDALTDVSDFSQLHEGDIIFQTSKSEQSKYIQFATGSRMSHCGIIVKVGNRFKVLEASSTVRLTNIKDFIARGKDGKFWIKRPEMKNIKIKYSSYLGHKYDLAFRFDNKKYYCSELVYLIYKKQFGIELCEPKTVSSYSIFGLDKILKRRRINPSQKVVAPSDIYRSDVLKDI